MLEQEFVEHRGLEAEAELSPSLLQLSGAFTC